MVETGFPRQERAARRCRRVGLRSSSGSYVQGCKMPHSLRLLGRHRATTAHVFLIAWKIAFDCAATSADLCRQKCSAHVLSVFLTAAHPSASFCVGSHKSTVAALKIGPGEIRHLRHLCIRLAPLSFPNSAVRPSQHLPQQLVGVGVVIIGRLTLETLDRSWPPRGHSTRHEGRMTADGRGRAIGFRIAPRQAHELPHAIPNLDPFAQRAQVGRRQPRLRQPSLPRPNLDHRYASYDPDQA